MARDRCADRTARRPRLGLIAPSPGPDPATKGLRRTQGYLISRGSQFRSLTPVIDTNEPGDRRTARDHQTGSSQVTDALRQYDGRTAGSRYDPGTNARAAVRLTAKKWEACLCGRGLTRNSAGLVSFVLIWLTRLDAWKHFGCRIGPSADHRSGPDTA